jgi:hypothetical protein
VLELFGYGESLGRIADRVLALLMGLPWSLGAHARWQSNVRGNGLG